MRSTRLFLIFFVFVQVSCFKSTEEFIPNNEIGDVNNLLEKLDANKISTLFDANKDAFLVTNEKAIVEVPAGSLLDARGKVVTGSVIAEYFIDKGFALELASGRPLKSAQEDISKLFSFSLKFKQGNAELSINPASKGILVYVPYVDQSDINTTKMYRWSGENWSKVTDEQNVGDFATGSWDIPAENGTIFGIGYKVSVKQSGDYLIGFAKAKSDFIELCVNLPENYSSKNTVAYVLLPNEKLVKTLNFEKGKFCSKEVSRGSFVKVITLSDQDGQFLYGETSYKSSGNVILTMVPKQKSVLEIWNLLIEL